MTMDTAGNGMAARSDTSSVYEIFAIRYGRNEGRLRGQNFILEANPQEKLPMDFYCWVLKSTTRTIVVDTGMHPQKASSHGHAILLDPIEAMRRLGVDPADADTVILTHMHFDHIGNVDAFPNARFHLQAEEMNYVTGPWMQKPWFRRAYEADEIIRLVRLLHEGRLNLHGREADIADGVSVHWVGGHCAGQEIVRVRTNRGWVVLASDALHYYEEIDRGVPFSVGFNLSDMLAAHDRIRDLADSDAHVVPAHDPAIIDLYPAVSGLEGVAVHVDLPPVAR